MATINKEQTEKESLQMFYETLNELNKENLIKFKLIYKRLDPKNNCIESKRKFLAVVTKK